MNEAKDFEITQPPTDGISDISFSSQADFLAASSWDSQVRIWEIQANGSSVGKAMYAHEGPVLCCSWSKDGAKIASGGADKAGRLYDIASGQTIQVAQHDEPIRCCKFLDNSSNILATGSWDKTLKYWDLRSSTPIAQIQLPDRCYSLDTSQQLLVVATAERHIIIVDLNNPGQAWKTIQSPLKWQTRCVSCFRPNANGYAVGSIEGRVGIQYLEEKEPQTNFSFKCHRENANVFSVNAISFHPVHGTFSTAGADGTMNFWDKDSKQRLKTFNSAGAPIAATCFNRNGTIFAYAVSYDWSKGYQHSSQSSNKNTIYLHAVKEDDVKPRSQKKR